MKASFADRPDGVSGWAGKRSGYAAQPVIRLSGWRGGETMSAMGYVVRPLESMANLTEPRPRRERRLSSR